MSQRDLFPVSCKVVLVSPDRRKVLLVRTSHGLYSLPGGHMDEGELPEEAAVRELREELGITSELHLEQLGFLRARSGAGKVVLGYQATLDPRELLKVDPSEIAEALWVEHEDLQGSVYDIREYQELLRRL